MARLRFLEPSPFYVKTMITGRERILCGARGLPMLVAQLRITANIHLDLVHMQSAPKSQSKFIQAAKVDTVLFVLASNVHIRHIDLAFVGSK